VTNSSRRKTENEPGSDAGLIFLRRHRAVAEFLVAGGVYLQNWTKLVLVPEAARNERRNDSFSAEFKAETALGGSEGVADARSTTLLGKLERYASSS
jgi:hypothetical protein